MIGDVNLLISKYIYELNSVTGTVLIVGNTNGSPDGILQVVLLGKVNAAPYPAESVFQLALVDDLYSQVLEQGLS